MKWRVVYNGSFGGFSLSEKALAEFRLLNGEEWDGNRAHAQLVEIVERLGVEANGYLSNLQIHDLKGHLYRIYEYDGLEAVEEPAGVEWTDASSNTSATLDAAAKVLELEAALRKLEADRYDMEERLNEALATRGR